MSTPDSDIAYLSRALKAPRIHESAGRLAEQARDAGWSHEEYLAAVLATEVTSREASGASIRIRTAGFGTVKSIEDVNFEHQPGTKRDTIAHLATGTYLHTWPATCCRSGLIGSQSGLVQVQTSAYWLGAW